MFLIFLLKVIANGFWIFGKACRSTSPSSRNQVDSSPPASSYSCLPKSSRPSPFKSRVDRDGKNTFDFAPPSVSLCRSFGTSHGECHTCCTGYFLEGKRPGFQWPCLTPSQMTQWDVKNKIRDHSCNAALASDTQLKNQQCWGKAKMGWAAARRYSQPWKVISEHHCENACELQ